MDLAATIEEYLLSRRDWVPAGEIVARFGLRDDRPLRAVDDQPGLCSRFAISSERGLKHVALASTAEWIRFKHRLRRHGIGELCRVRDLDLRRASCVRACRRPPALFERDSRQALFAEIVSP